MRKRHQPGCPCCEGGVTCGTCNVPTTLYLTTPFGVATLHNIPLTTRWYGCLPWSTTTAAYPVTADCAASSDPVLATRTSVVAFVVQCFATSWRLRAHAASVQLRFENTGSQYWFLPVPWDCLDAPVGFSTSVQSDCRPGGGFCANYFEQTLTWFGATDDLSVNPLGRLGLGTLIVTSDAGSSCSPVFARWTGVTFGKGTSHLFLSCPVPADPATVYNGGTLTGTYTLSP